MRSNIKVGIGRAGSWNCTLLAEGGGRLALTAGHTKPRVGSLVRWAQSTATSKIVESIPHPRFKQVPGASIPIGSDLRLVVLDRPAPASVRRHQLARFLGHYADELNETYLCHVARCFLDAANRSGPLKLNLFTAHFRADPNRPMCSTLGASPHAYALEAISAKNGDSSAPVFLGAGLWSVCTSGNVHATRVDNDETLAWIAATAESLA